jgi:hypothetical protein
MWEGISSRSLHGSIDRLSAVLSREATRDRHIEAWTLSEMDYDRALKRYQRRPT